MICAIMQPTYIPWIGYFDLIDKVDVFVFFNDVQLTKRSWQVRNRIKSPNGEVWLTIPIKKTKNRNETLIMDALPNYNEKWIDNHLKTIEFNYKKSLYFDPVFEVIKKEYQANLSLGDFNINIIQTISKKLGIKTKFIKSSDIKGINGRKDERLVQICNAIKADSYLSPQGSAIYINEKIRGGAFPENNIELFYHNYKHPIYNQLYKDFIPYLGIYDLLFNEGFDKSLDIIKQGRLENIYYTAL